MTLKHIPFTDVAFAPVTPILETVDATTTIVRNPVALPSLARHLGEHLRYYAETTPDRVFLAERQLGAPAIPTLWQTVSYAQAYSAVRAIASALLARQLPPERPVMVISGNSIGHGLFLLAANYIGLPVLPVSPNYALVDPEATRLRWINERFAPSLVYAEDERYRPALQVLGIPDQQVVTRRASASWPAVNHLDAWQTFPEHAQLAHAETAVAGSTIAKIILTSGSTGNPKGVAISQAMMLAAAESFTQLWPFLQARPPIMVDWLPWNHTAGSNGTLNLILRNGGSLYIDDGKPTESGISRTLENLASIQPTLMFNVPRGYEYLVPALEQRPALSRQLLQDLDVLLYAGAGLSQDTWDRLEHLAVQARGRRIPIVSSLGSTETASPATLSWWGADLTGSIGLPIPGVEAKLIQHPEKMEIRFRGATVMERYWDDPERTAAAFDDDGFFRIGDAVRWMVSSDPSKGLCFDGRLAENFKLSSGIWVNVGTLRLSLITACAPWIEDVVVTGESHDGIGVLVFANGTALRLAGHDAPQARQVIRHALHAFNQRQPGVSQRIQRFVLEVEPLSTIHGEITDKGYVAQSRVLQRRAPRVAQLYATPTHPDVDVLS